jgi:hypothetical protein
MSALGRKLPLEASLSRLLPPTRANSQHPARHGRVLSGNCHFVSDPANLDDTGHITKAQFVAAAPLEGALTDPHQRCNKVLCDAALSSEFHSRSLSFRRFPSRSAHAGSAMNRICFEPLFRGAVMLFRVQNPSPSSSSRTHAELLRAQRWGGTELLRSRY